MKQAVILAGGKGTRLRSELGDLPKPLVEIGGIPLLQRQLEQLLRGGLSDVLVLVNHEADQIAEWCASNPVTGQRVTCIDDGEARGTAGATLAVYDRLEPEFLITYGDTLFEVDLSRFTEYHRKRSTAVATLFLHPNDHPQDSDLVEVASDGRILAFYPSPHGEGQFLPNLVNAALYVVRRDALKPWFGRPGVLDFGKDLFPEMLDKGLWLHGYISPEYIKDVGTPKRLARVRTDLASGRVARSCLSVAQKAVFLDRDGTLNRQVGYVSRPEQLTLLPGVGEAISALNHSEYKAIVVTNQPVLARGDCTESELRAIHNKLETLLALDEAYLDRICVCPHHPDSGFAGEVPALKTDCACRKPKTGMIDRMVDEFHVDVSQSWLIGDSTVDIITAKRAGLRSVLVETGEGGLDGRHVAVPDYIAADLSSAVSFILHDHPRLLAFCGELASNLLPGALVFIGGLSRSGKSTFAHGLKEAMAQRGVRSCVLAVDRWLRSADVRSDTVLGRYNLHDLESLVHTLGSNDRPLTLQLPAYDKRHRRQIAQADTVFIDFADVVIIEGVPALFLSQYIASQSIYRWFVESDEAKRRERVIREYLLRGETLEAAETIYCSRQEDETPIVLKSAENSAIRISLPFDD